MDNEISRSIYGQSNLRLQSKQSTSGGGSCRLVTEIGFRFSFHLSESNLVRINSAIFILKKVITKHFAVVARSIFRFDFRSS